MMKLFHIHCMGPYDSKGPIYTGQAYLTLAVLNFGPMYTICILINRGNDLDNIFQKDMVTRHHRQTFFFFLNYTIDKLT